MGFFSFLRRRVSNELPVSRTDTHEYFPAFWDDDYCQIEIVPKENKEFVMKQIGQIEDLSAKSKVDYGFTDIFVRGKMPFPTVSKELRADYLEKTLLSFRFQKAKRIRFDGRDILDCETGDTRAFGFSNCTVFFDIQDEFVKNIWIDIHRIDSSPQFDDILAALYTLGEECGLVLIDWNSSALFDLADKSQIERYLVG